MSYQKNPRSNVSNAIFASLLESKVFILVLEIKLTTSLPLIDKQMNKKFRSRAKAEQTNNRQRKSRLSFLWKIKKLITKSNTPTIEVLLNVPMNIITNQTKKDKTKRIRLLNTK